MGPIRIISVIDNSSLSNQVNGYAQNVWNNIDHPNAEEIYILNVQESAGNASLAEQMKVDTLPSVVFAEVIPGPGNTVRTITAIAGGTSEAQIEAIYLQVLNGQFTPGSGDDGTDTPIIPGDGEPGGGFGIPNPFFSSSTSIGWLLIAGFSAYKAATSETAGMLIWGSLGGLAAVQYAKKKEEENQSWIDWLDEQAGEVMDVIT